MENIYGKLNLEAYTIIQLIIKSMNKAYAKFKIFITYIDGMRKTVE